MARAPLGIKTPLWPPEKVSCASDSGLMAEVPAEPLSGRARVAEDIGRSEPPKAFEMTRRMVGAD